MLLLGLGAYWGYLRYRGVELWKRVTVLLTAVGIWQALVIFVDWRSKAGLEGTPFAEVLIENIIIDLLLLGGAYGLGRGLARWRKGKATP